MGWLTYVRPDLSAHAVLDSGLLSNFPLELFLSDEPYVVELMGPKHDIPVLGLLIDESLPVPAMDAVRGRLADLDVDLTGFRTVQRIRRLADTATTARDTMVAEAYGHLVVRLPARGYGTTEFDMSDERRAALVEGGRVAMRAYFDRPPATPDGARGFEAAEGPRMQEAANRIAMRLLASDA